MTSETSTVAWGCVPEMLAAHGNDPEAATQALIAQLDQAELIHMVSGDRPLGLEILDNVRNKYNNVPYPAGAQPRLGYPGMRFADGPRGIVVGNSTAVPIPMARAATFDPAIEREIGEAIGKEGTAQGANLFGGVCINLVRHPAWGRAQETYGEDTHLLAVMGVAMSESVGNHMIACIKHFALNSLENSRFIVDVEIADADLNDIYLPHFKACVDAGALSVMSAYNKVNGQWAGHNHRLLTEILKESWGFQGPVMSDFGFGVRNMVDALQGGLDIEMPVSLHARRVPAAVANGSLQMERVRDAATRSARAVFVQASRTGAKVASRSVINCEDHRNLARRAAADSIVLLTNQHVDGDTALPLGRTSSNPATRVALIGKLADLAQTGDKGSSEVRSARVVSPVEGFRAHSSRHGIELVESLNRDRAKARSAASGADAAVVVVGNTWRDEGEFMGIFGGDRKRLRLRRADVELVETVAAECPRTIVVLLGGSAFVTEGWRHNVAALVMGWYLGDEGGNALAEVVLGDTSPGGRLPVTWPATESQLPKYNRWTSSVTYGPLHGYRLFHQTGRLPAFWFGHGLSYTTTEWGEPALSGSDDAVTVTVANTGARPGSEVVQAYLNVALGTHTKPLPTLVGFAKVRLDPGESTEARVELDAELLAKAQAQGGDAGRVWIGRSASPHHLTYCGRTTPSNALRDSPEIRATT